MGLIKGQKQGRDENTRRLSCYRKAVVKKDWKTTLLLLQKLSKAKEVDKSSSLSTFLQEDSLLVFSSLPCFCTFSGPSLLALTLTENFLPLVYVLIRLLGSKLIKRYDIT